MSNDKKNPKHITDVDRETLYDLVPLANLTGHTEAAVRGWARKGQIKAVRFGRGWRVVGAEIIRVHREGVSNPKREAAA